MSELLNSINSPQDLKNLNGEQLKAYADEVRQFIIASVKNTGGHLSSNLGTVEMSIALHYVFSSPDDKILWDVGHQSYTHKIITGRRDRFDGLRKNGGISGFPKPSESEHDAFTMGHSSTSLSVGLGFARARALTGASNEVVSVIGDGAFTGGMVFEALNDIGASRTKMIIVLNDNKMSISKNVGAFSNYLAKLRLSKRYSRIKYNIKKGAQALPFFGDKIVRALDRSKDAFKSLVQTNQMFESMGIKYYGPFDGHNMVNMVNIFRQVQHENKPVLIHLITKKGRGDDDAESDPSRYHGVTPGGLMPEQAFSSVLSRFLSQMADEGENVAAISAAMLDGTGLSAFSKAHPERCFDVGIAEQHASSMAAGLASGGVKPFFSVYSTFLQRAFDQVLHDVCIDRLPVVFAIDRAGAVGADGVTHQGVFDLSYLSLIPNLTVCAPKDGNELYKILIWSLAFARPLAIRYPKGFRHAFDTDFEIRLGKWEMLVKNQSNVYILAVGSRMLEIATAVSGVNVVNACFVKPLDTQFLDQINRKGNLLITLEDNILRGGFGESVLACCHQLTQERAKTREEVAQTPKNYNKIGEDCARIVTLGYADSFLENYDIADSLAQAGLNVENLKKIIREFTGKPV